MSKRTASAANPEKLFLLLKHQREKRLPSFFRHFSIDVALAPPTTSKENDAAVVGEILELLQGQGRDDNWNEDGLRRLLSSSDDSSSISRRLLQVIRRLGDSSKSLKFFQWIQKNSSSSSSLSESLPSSSSAYQIIFELGSRELNPHIKLHEFLKLSRDQGVLLTSNSAFLLIRCFLRARMITESLQVFKEIDPSLRNTRICNTLLDGLCKSDRIDDAHHILDEMLKPGSVSHPNDITGSIVFSAFTKRKQPGRITNEEKVIELIPKLGEQGVFPDSFQLTQLITKLCRGGNTEQAWHALHVIMKMGGRVEAPSCNALLSGLGRELDFQRMNQLLAEMKEMGIQPNVITFGVLINHLCKSRRVDEALQVLEKMTGVEQNDGFSVQPDVISFNTLIDGLCKVGRQEEGLSLLNRMRSEYGCAPNTITYNCLIDGFCKAGEIERSLELFVQMNEEGVQQNVVTLNTLVDGMCKNGRISSAMKFFNDMQAKGLKGNAVTYTVLISAFCNVNNIDKAMALFDEMLNARCPPDSIVYYSLISGFCRAGRLDDACSVVSKMQVAGFCLDAISYNTLISCFCKKKRLDEASEMVKEMEKAGIRPDEVTYNTLIAALSKSGDFSGAHALMTKMIDRGLVPTVVTYGAVIHGYCIAGNLEEAMKIFRGMSCTSKVPPNTVIYNILIDSLCKNKEIEMAVSLMDDMRVKGVPPNTTTYNAMFKGLQEMNWLEKAFELMDWMNEEACNPDYTTMEILTEWLSAVGETSKLRSFVQGYKVSASRI